MLHPEIAGAEPAALEGGLRRGRVLQVAAHHHVAAEHHLAEARAVGGQRLHRLGIAHVEPFQHGVAHALAGLLPRTLVRRQRVPFLVPRIDHRRAVGLGQTIEVRDVEAGLAHGGEHRLGRRRGGGEEVDPAGEGTFLCVGSVEQRRHHDRRPRQVGDAVLGERRVHRGRPHLPQADMGAGDDRERPGEAPAVAVEHRQGPEIDRVLRQPGGDDVAEREQSRAAVVVDHALRIAGGAGGVVERDRVPLVRRHRPSVVGIAAGEECLVVNLAQGRALAGEFRIVVIDDERRDARLVERLAADLREFAVDDEHLGLAVVEAEGQSRRVEPGVEGVEHRSRHRHAVVALDHRRRVGQQHRHGVAAADAARRQGRTETAAAGIEFGIGPAQGPVDHRDPVREGSGGAVEIGQRRERLEVRGIPVEIPIVHRRARHRPRLRFRDEIS